MTLDRFPPPPKKDLIMVLLVVVVVVLVNHNLPLVDSRVDEKHIRRLVFTEYV
jgi:hypothetical protein